VVSDVSLVLIGGEILPLGGIMTIQFKETSANVSGWGDHEASEDLPLS